MSETVLEYRSENLIAPDCSFHIFFSSDCLEMPRHTHNFIEIIYVCDGSATETVNDRSFEVKRGDLLFINYGCTHAFVPHGRVSFFNVCFDPVTASERAFSEGEAFALLQISAFEELRGGNDTGRVTFRGKERDEMEELLKQMQGEYKEDAPFKRAVLESYMSILLVKILRKVASTPKEDSTKGSWQEMSDYIDRNLGSDLTLSALAQRYFYNPSYLSRVFKKQFGASLTEYIGKRRISQAIRLLRETKLTVNEIATQVGYPSKSAFYRAFAKITGGSPSDYRK